MSNTTPTKSLWFNTFEIATINELKKVQEKIGNRVVVHPAFAGKIRVDIYPA